jgi:hypothetical protein
MDALIATAKALAKQRRHTEAAAAWMEVAAAWAARKGTVIPIEPIEYFFMKSSKADNDAANDVRERYLEGLLDLTGLTDPRAVVLQNAWRAVIHGLCPVEFATVKIYRKGGRGANYDFLCEFLAEDGATVVASVPVEFKYGASTIAGLPQFLSLAEKDLPFPVTYAEHYYDRYLPAYVATDAALGAVALPDRATYCRRVYSDAYDSHPFFRAAKDHEETAKDAKAAIVNESIRTFLEECGGACDLAHLSSLLRGKQEGKVFVMWDGAGAFHVERLGAEDLTVAGVIGVRNGNCLEVRTAGGRTFKLLLRWKNHKGVLYPAWQISMARN